MIRRWLIFLVLAFSLLGQACALRGGVGGERLALHAQGAELVGDGDHSAAAAVYQKLLAKYPDDLVARYNLACCLALGGDLAGAYEHLNQAVMGGFSDEALLKSDPDLDALRGDAKFSQVLDLAGHVLREQKERTVLLLPENMKPGERVPLVLFLHGHLGSPVDLEQALKPLVDDRRVALMLPAGGQVFRLPCGKPVFAWLAHDEKRLLAEVEQMLSEHSLDGDRVYAMGFSAGAVLALKLGLGKRELFGGVLAMAGYLPETWFEQRSSVRNSGPKPPVVLVFGSSDRGVQASAVRRGASLLERAGHPVSVMTFRGGHHFPRDVVTLVSRAMNWMIRNSKRP